MNCLLVAATAKEIAPFLDRSRAGAVNPSVDVLITGVGLTAVTYSLVKQVGLKKPGLIIQAGIAGCFDPNISLGSVVVVRQDTIADLGVTEDNQLNTVFDLGLIDADRFPFKKGWLVNPNSKLIGQTGLKAVNAVSVNHITTSKQMTESYKRKFDPIIESMEGAALHYVCLQENIPFLQLRSISNYIGERDKKKWNIKEAILNLDKQIARLTDNFQP
ncbi:MAG TPA: futalosine hydrolase [Chitinophagaceae bacterium]|nr:futalosine hydrolase [Chitinophagaceae bacterium]